MFGFKKTPTTKTSTDSDQTCTGLERGLQRTRNGLFAQLRNYLSRGTDLDPALLDELEDHMISADIGMTVTAEIMDSVRDKVRRKSITCMEEVLEELNSGMLQILGTVHTDWLPGSERKPCFVMLVGVNGVGKTTTIGKLARKFMQTGNSVMLAAGDTFRAAAIEQLQRWGEKNQVPVISQSTGADAAAVIFDALQSARARNIDILIADTAGRLHTQNNLMQELEKVSRVASKFDPELPRATLLVLDATTGQNALVQAREFHAAIGIDGIILTKLDGTAKGGIVFALARELGIPIRFIGVGEQLDDLQPFDPDRFVAALLANDA
ncbi:MAG: signal recognition particle-docking protein FtsY [Thiotrichales bacterium]|nr:signal recognition particle-docking protein FtsY [Thiotrichales bacterium]